MKKKYTFSAFLILLSMVLFSQTAINNDGSGNAESAILDVKSTSKGLLIPRLTLSQRISISSPPNGLLVFDTTLKTFWYYDGTKTSWRQIVGISNTTEVKDRDSDTKIQVEESSDEDKIRFDIANYENLVMNNGRIDIINYKGTVYIGQGAGENSINGYRDNTFVGYNSGKSNTEGYNNTAIGYQSLNSNTTSHYNVAAGNQALANSIGKHNTAIGVQAGLSCGDSNVCIGFQAGALETGNNKLYIENSWSSSPLIHGDFRNNLVTINGKLGIGVAPYASSKLSVSSNLLVTGEFLNMKEDDEVKILHAEYTNTGNYDAIAVEGSVQPNPNGNYGYGGHLNGDYIGVKAINNPGSSVGSSYGVYAKNYGTAGMRYGIYGEATGGTNRYGVFGKSTSTSSNHYAMYCDGNGVYTGTWLNSSDKKLKKNIQPMQNALEKLTKLTPSTYQFKTDEYSYINLAQGIQFGFIAQEMEAVFPELVSTVAQPKSHEKETNIEEFKAINYIGLIPVLTQAIKEQQSLIDKKQQLIDTLTKRLEIIESY